MHVHTLPGDVRWSGKHTHSIHIHTHTHTSLSGLSEMAERASLGEREGNKSRFLTEERTMAAVCLLSKSFGEDEAQEFKK